MTVLLYILTGQWYLDYFQPASAAEGEEGKDWNYMEEAEDLETPLVNGSHAHPPADGRHHMPLPPAAAAQEAIPIGSVRRGSSYGAATGTPIGSYSRAGARGTPYERGSFTMYINTFGSHTSPHGRGLLSSQPVSEEPEH
jgi:hypothetical protein